MLRFLHPCLKEFVGFVAASHVRPFSSSSALFKEKQPATPKVPVPPPTSGVPAQGGMAATAVAEAKRGLEALQQEKKTVLSVISELEVYCSSRSTDTERSAAGGRLWRDFRIDVQNSTTANASLEDQKLELKSVNTELVEVRKQQTFAMQAQVPQVCWLCTCVVDA